MKMSIFLRRLFAVITVIAMAHLTTIPAAFAKMPHSQSDGAQAQAEYPPEELELLRAKLLDLIDASKDVTGLLPDNASNLERLEKARTQIEQFSDKDLAHLRRSLDPSVVDWAGLERARKTLADYKSSELGQAQQRSRAKLSSGRGAFSPTSAGFPTASPFCGANRFGAEAIIAIDIVFFAADLVRELAQDSCKQVVVVAGVGGNTSLACIPIDIAWIGDKAIYEAAHFCDDDFTDAIVDANYARLEHIHGDLENSVANDNANTASIIANANSNASSIISNENSNKTATITNDNSNKAAMIANDNTNTATITTAISNAVTSINGGSGSAQNQLKELIQTAQIESDLARDTGSSPVALYELPASFGGLLDKVRSIVAQTIANVQAAGGSVGNAQMFLTQGDQNKAAGHFKAAYDQYRRAYQMAAR
jgi:hypothetical protein